MKIKQIHFMVSEKEHTQLMNKAKKAKMKLSEFCRFELLNKSNITQKLNEILRILRK